MFKKEYKQARFLSKLKLKYLGRDKYGMKQWETKSNLVFFSGIDIIDIPSGQKTDLASIPTYLHGILPQFDIRYNKGSILHDYLYEINYNRLKADNLFLVALKVGKTPFIMRWAFYLAVRLFGWIHHPQLKISLSSLYNKIFRSEKNVSNG